MKTEKCKLISTVFLNTFLPNVIKIDPYNFEIRPKLLLITDRKLLMRFNWHQGWWPWMTLNCYKFEFSWNFARFRTFGRQQRLNDRIQLSHQFERWHNLAYDRIYGRGVFGPPHVYRLRSGLFTKWTIVREYVFYVFLCKSKNATFYVFWSVMSKNVKM